MSYWLLITHSAALFPIGTLLWSWKERRELESIFMMIQFIFCVFFSLMYHANQIQEITLGKKGDVWTLMDSFFSTSLIMTTILYSLHVKNDYLYIISSTTSTITLLINLLDVKDFVVYLIIIEALGAIVFKWRNLKRIMLNFKLLFTFMVCCIVTAIICYITAVSEYYNQIYIDYHSSWHVFIFTSAGSGCLIRYKLDQLKNPVSNRPRELEMGDML